jgi:hypothetical protein
MKRFLLLFSVAAGLSLLFHSCRKEASFPPEPHITFKEFNKLGHDSSQLVVTFTDGDGDIGLNQDDTTGHFARNQKFYYNFFCRYYYKDASGNFVPYLTYLNNDTILDTLDFNYRVPYLTQNGQKESLTGDIVVSMYPFPFYYIPGHHTIRYEIWIADRALNVSNKVMSTDIEVP